MSEEHFEDHLIYLENYKAMRGFVEDRKAKSFTVNTDDINEDTWSDYYFGVLNIFRDGIEHPLIRTKVVKVVFGTTGLSVELYITDFFINLLLWYTIVYGGGRIMPYHLVKKYDDEGFTSKDIKSFVDDYFLMPYRTKLPIRLLNNIISDCLYNWFPINEFYGYLAVTLNLKDSIDLMKASPEYYHCLHYDFSGVPIEDVNNVGMQVTRQTINIEKNAKQFLGFDHCLAASWRAKEGKDRQYKECLVNIGTKPDGSGNVFPHIINSSYANGGITNFGDFFVDATVARTAQILTHINVRQSGHFARLLGLNNSNTFLVDDIDNAKPCNTIFPLPIELKTSRHVEMYIDRFYKEKERGEVKLITKDDVKRLTHKTILVYSPMTCNSHSHGNGICPRCYGTLYHINKNINIGKMASEMISNILTQRLLSSKHLLESRMKKIVWPEIFDKYFEISFNAIVLKSDANTDGVIMQLDRNDFIIDNEEDYDSSSAVTDLKEHVSYFKLIVGGEVYEIRDNDNRDLFISEDLNKAIQKHAFSNGEEDMISIELEKLEDMPIFFIELLNDELSRALTSLTNTINNKPITSVLSAPEILQKFIDTTVDGGLEFNAIHAEVILSNQIHNSDDFFEPINWGMANPHYKMVTLKDALFDNKSVTISLMYQELAKTFITPLSYRKHAPSFIDLFFMEEPQKFLNGNFAASVHDSEIPNMLPFYIDDSEIERRRKLATLPFEIR